MKWMDGVMLLLVCSLSGCVSTASDESVNVTQLVGDRFVGGPIQEMTARYGAPLRQMPLSDETVYSWEKSDTLYFDTPLHVTCQLDAYVTPDGVVRTVGTNGNYGACVRFAP